MKNIFLKLVSPVVWLFRKMKQNWKEAGGYAGKRSTQESLQDESDYQQINDILN